MPHTGSTMRLANLRGTLSLAVHDRFSAATEAASGASGSGPAALATPQLWQGVPGAPCQ